MPDDRNPYRPYTDNWASHNSAYDRRREQERRSWDRATSGLVESHKQFLERVGRTGRADVNSSGAAASSGRVSYSNYSPSLPDGPAGRLLTKLGVALAVIEIGFSAVQPLAILTVWICLGTCIAVGLGAWLLGYGDPATIGAEAAIFVFRVIGTIAATILMQGIVLVVGSFAVLKPVLLGILDAGHWFFKQTFFTMLIAIIAATFSVVVVVGAYLYVQRIAPRFLKLAWLVAVAGIALLFWLPIHITDTVAGWQVLHEKLGWLMVV